MAARVSHLALAAALALAAPLAAASDPWRKEPMTIPLDSTYTDVLVGNFTRPGATSGADLLVIDGVTHATEARPFHALLTRQTTVFSFQGLGLNDYRSGYLAQNGGDAWADVVRGLGPGNVLYAFGNDGVPRTYYLSPWDCSDDLPAFFHLLPGSSDVLVLPCHPDWQGTGSVAALSFDASPIPTVAQWKWPLGSSLFMDAPLSQAVSPWQKFDAAPIRISQPALTSSYGLEDVALLGFGGAVLFVHRTPPATASLSAIDFEPAIEVGGNRGVINPAPVWLPPTVPMKGDVLGIAAVDVNLDGKPDLVFPQSNLNRDANGDPQQAAVVWVEGTGIPSDFGDWNETPWHDLGLQLGLPMPLIVRQVEVAGVPAAAIWDRALQEVIVAWPDYAAGTLRTWRAPAPGEIAIDIHQVDVVGSPAKDLVVVMDNTYGSARAADAVLVYPDAGLTSPALSWAPGSPGTPARGVPHAMGVALDPAGPASVTVDWVQGAPTTAPIGQGLSHVFAPVCTMPPPDLVVTVRATDDTGVFTELGATLPVSALQPAISLRGASKGTLVLEPDGVTTAVFDGVAATGCGAASWGGAWPAAATVSDEIPSASDWVRRTVTLPSAAYPELLSDPSLAVSLATTDPGVADPVVTLPLRIDGSKLVEVIHESDRTALAGGELAVLRTRLRNRIACPLPRVRVVDVLAGLTPASAPSVTGAAVVSLGSGGAEVVLDALPAAPAEVTIELPVRSAGGQGASAVEAWSEAGWPLTPPAQASAREALPGCGCGAGGAGSGLTLLALLLAGIRRGRRA